MNKLVMMILVSLCSFSINPAFACGDMTTTPTVIERVKNFFATKPRVIRINQLEKMPSPSLIYLKGIISKPLGKHQYVFRDPTGKINIHIPKHVLNGRKLNNKQHLYFYASMEKLSCGAIKIEVKKIMDTL